MHYGVYAVGHAGETLDAQLMAAVLAGGDGALLSRWASASLAGLVRWDGRAIDVTVRGSSGRARPGIRFHRARALDPRDVTVLHGIPTTTPARTLLEIAPQLSDARLKRARAQAQAERLANVRQIRDDAALAPTVTERRSGSRRSSPPARRRRIAAMRTSCSICILDAGLEHPDVNARLVVGGTPYYPDMRWPAQRLILEIDSAWHDGRIAHELDDARQAALEAAGERVLRTVSST